MYLGQRAATIRMHWSVIDLALKVITFSGDI